MQKSVRENRQKVGKTKGQDLALYNSTQGTAKPSSGKGHKADRLQEGTRQLCLVEFKVLSNKISRLIRHK